MYSNAFWSVGLQGYNLKSLAGRSIPTYYLFDLISSKILADGFVKKILVINLYRLNDKIRPEL
jgi:hypothetical protein